nr:acylphosphatase [Candidatus Acidoferrales bacterium]
MTTSLLAKRFYVSGGVQGVGYRFFAQRVASTLGVRGYVKNLFDGRVEVYAIAAPEVLAAFREQLKRGPRFASVDEVAEAEAEMLPQYENEFFIEHES